LAPPPIEWHEGEGWMAETEIPCELTAALEGVELNEATFAK